MLYQMTRFLLSCLMTIGYPDSIAIQVKRSPVGGQVVLVAEGVVRFLK